MTVCVCVCVILRILAYMHVCRLCFFCFLVTHLHNIGVGPALMGLIVLGVFQQDLVHICAGVLEQFVGAIEDDQGNLTVTQHTQLVRLLHQAELSLCECHLGRNKNTPKETKDQLQSINVPNKVRDLAMYVHTYG